MLQAVPRTVNRRSIPSEKRWAYGFEEFPGRNTEQLKTLLGGKGANLSHIYSLGLPVPPGFTLTTEACAEYARHGRRFYARQIKPAVIEALDNLRRRAHRLPNRAHFPLLLSVRSGAAVSMPGMMDTVLNIGVNDATCDQLAEVTGNRRFALDVYRRLINMYADVVEGVPHEAFEELFDNIKSRHGVQIDADLNEDGMAQLVTDYLALFRKATGKPFPQEPAEQLTGAIEGVFGSWNTPRAITYRRAEHIEGLPGTAANVQVMVFGNLGRHSGSGVGFTRDPGTGANRITCEFLPNAQGEDVVAGIRTPLSGRRFRRLHPDAWNRLLQIKETLESTYGDMQDFEFTIENNTLYLLQTRSGKRTAAAAIKIACDLQRAGVISQSEAVAHVAPLQIKQILTPTFAPDLHPRVLACGLPASPGAAVGQPAFTPEEATERTENGESVILVRPQTSADDISGMQAARGVITSTGGVTSHAAVIARGWGKPCIVGIGNMTINTPRGVVQFNGKKLTRKDTLSIDGATGQIMLGELPTRPAQFGGDTTRLLRWADGIRRMRVRANADTPEDALKARRLGAEGIGLCRTEHMFFAKNRVPWIQRMILADNTDDEREAIRHLLPFQRDDFTGLFQAMRGLPVTIRLLDPPLHEFLPDTRQEKKDLAKTMGVSLPSLEAMILPHHETNPMLGMRGCRLLIKHRMILDMQVRAIVEATVACRRKKLRVHPQIMIPLVSTVNEFTSLREDIEAMIRLTVKGLSFNGGLTIPIGTMIETPRAALLARDLARHADFFSFGTNDLTQMTFGFSRDDAGAFLPEYIDKGILPENPFSSIDTAGVGNLMRSSIDLARKQNPDLEIGICGEHGGDPRSIRFFESVGMDYVSCSPLRVPVARLATAHVTQEGAARGGTRR
ncbi:MAG: pyruvate, phosphate dikinase [Planctomycetota bacterium]|jgi:pyruvate,orthophosphate dikinase